MNTAHLWVNNFFSCEDPRLSLKHFLNVDLHSSYTGSLGIKLQVSSLRCEFENTIICNIHVYPNCIAKKLLSKLSCHSSLHVSSSACRFDLIVIDLFMCSYSSLDLKIN